MGLTRGSNKYHVVRATLESLAYQVGDVLHAMEEDSGIKLDALKVDGGASANNFLMQIQSDIHNVPVVRPACIETTALGAAYLAGLAVGYWASLEDIASKRSEASRFEPDMPAEQRAKMLNGWKKAVNCTLGWEK